MPCTWLPVLQEARAASGGPGPGSALAQDPAQGAGVPGTLAPPRGLRGNWARWAGSVSYLGRSAEAAAESGAGRPGEGGQHGWGGRAGEHGTTGGRAHSHK